jgi:hypothetical protein
MDVKSAFPNGVLEEEVYVKQSPKFESEKYPHRVYKLRKALYGLKQSLWLGMCWRFLRHYKICNSARNPMGTLHDHR